MLPSLASFTTFEGTPSMAGLPFRACTSSEHIEHLPSIFELLPELSRRSPSKAFDLHIRRENEPRCYGLRDYQIMNTCTVFNSPVCPHQKRRRLSTDDDEDSKRFSDTTEFRPREIPPMLGKWINYQQNSTHTPDISPSSRRSSTFSSSETWTGSPTNYFKNISSSKPVDHESSPFLPTESPSRPDPHVGFGNNSSPHFPSQKEFPEVNNVNGSRPQERYLHGLATLNPANRIHRSSCSNRNESEYYLEPTASMASSSQTTSKISGFHCPGSKTNGYRGDPQSEITSFPTTQRYLTQSPQSQSRFKTSMSEHPLFQSDPGHEKYAENICQYNNDSVISRETKPRKRRGNLPKETTDKLRTWFLNHLEHPYPTEDEKQQLMDSTGLQMNQISNWYINARRRQLPAINANARAEVEARRHIHRSPNLPSSKKGEMTREG